MEREREPVSGRDVDHLEHVADQWWMVVYRAEAQSVFMPTGPAWATPAANSIHRRTSPVPNVVEATRSLIVVETMTIPIRATRYRPNCEGGIRARVSTTR